MKKVGLILLLILILFIAIFIIEKQQFSPNQLEEDLPWLQGMNENEKAVLRFVVKKNSGPGLSVYTNYVNARSKNRTIATGKDVLSESQGLFLLYLVNRDAKEYFDSCLKWTADNLYIKNGTFSWIKRKSSQTETTNALIDDLRIVRALFLAYEKWNDEEYMIYIQKTSKALLAYNTDKDMPLDFYDNASRAKSDSITLSYIDLYTMEKLIAVDARWSTIYDNAYELIKNAKIDDTALYEFQYSLSTNRYTTSHKTSLIQSVYTIVHLAEIGEYDSRGMDWIYSEYKRYGKVYESYSNQTLKPISDIESTALYALIARAFYLGNEYEKAEEMLRECEKFQIKNINSEINGSFGNESNKEVYSFDNLQYIVSSSIIRENAKERVLK